MLRLFIPALFLYAFVNAESIPCSPKVFSSEQESVVCVCNATYCDTVEPNIKLPVGQYAVYTTSKAGQRFKKVVGKFDLKESKSTKVLFTVEPKTTYQTMLGFGGAFTDSATINIDSLSKASQKHLLQSYYSPLGIEYTLGRIPIASCDFSTHIYSYDDSPGDLSLTNFSLANEDMQYKIPTILAAKQMSSRNISIFGSAWSAPAWMKTNDKMTGYGTLIGQPGGKYYKAWANYHVKFLQAYEKHGIRLWGLTAQNEPSDGYIANFSFQAMGWTPESQRDYIALDLGPALEVGGYGDLKLMILDDQRIFLPEWAERVFNNEKAKTYVSGIAIHWYEDAIVPPITLDLAHKEFPDKFILSTEACTGEDPWDIPKVALGSWLRAERYLHDILTDIRHWVTGWVDWNIALDPKGGPNWDKNFVDSPVIVDQPNDKFYKQPMFYILGHFSKFVIPGAKRIEMKSTEDEKFMEHAAFMLPDNSIVAVISNRNPVAVNVTFFDPDLGYLNEEIPEYSVQTVIWWKK